jgi:hypothetical protein
MRKIFDGLYGDQLFHKNERGETVFYPFGLTGRGYLLPADRETAVRDATRRLSLASLVGGISLALLATRILNSPGAGLWGWLISGGAFVLLLTALFYFQMRLATGLEPAPGPRPSVGEWLRRGREARARWTYWACVVLGVFCLAMAGSSLALGFMDGGFASIAAGAFMLLVGALLTWDGVVGLIER